MKSLLLVAALAAALIAPTAAHAASPGAAGVGDRLFPTLGNGGYDVQHYDVSLNYATSAPSQGFDGTETNHCRNSKIRLLEGVLDHAGAR